jgi:hypothetical protein
MTHGLAIANFTRNRQTRKLLEMACWACRAEGLDEETLELHAHAGLKGNVEHVEFEERWQGLPDGYTHKGAEIRVDGKMARFRLYDFNGKTYNMALSYHDKGTRKTVFEIRDLPID